MDNGLNHLIKSSKLYIIFRSCSRVESQVHGIYRIVSKSECVLRCLKSVLLASKYLAYPHEVTVIDDHSDQRTLQHIHNLCQNVISIEDTGYSASLSFTYQYAKENCDDLIYFIEDDYLHESHSLRAMVDTYLLFKNQFHDKEIVIFPLDGNDRYKLNWLEPCLMVAGSERYWRTIFHTTANFMISKSLFLKGWSHFERFGLYNKDMDVCEANTIENIWKDPSVLVFAPIPTLTYHLQLEEHLPLFTYNNWKVLWNKFI